MTQEVFAVAGQGQDASYGSGGLAQAAAQAAQAAQLVSAVQSAQPAEDSWHLKKERQLILFSSLSLECKQAG